MTTVTNPTKRDIIMSQFEGKTYVVPAGGTLEIDNPRAALSIVDYGARIESGEERSQAVADERQRASDDRAGVSATRASDFELAVDATDAGTTVVGSVGSVQPVTPFPGGNADELRQGVVTGAPIVDTGDNPDAVADALELKGVELDKALEVAGLSRSGTADEKRQRLADSKSVTTAPPVVDPLEGMSDDDVLAALTSLELDTDGDVAAQRARLVEKLESN